MMSAPAEPRRRAWRILIPLALLLGGCGVLTSVTSPEPAPTPVVAVSTFVPTASPWGSASLRASSTPSDAPTQEATSSPPPCEAPSGATSLYCATKNGEGAHGGPPLLDLPNAIAMDYWVSGTCMFSMGLSTQTSAAGLPSLTKTVNGPAVAGTWRVPIKPGRYYPVIGEAVGCVYSVNVRDDR
jgi:hypothetical protein